MIISVIIYCFREWVLNKFCKMTKSHYVVVMYPLFVMLTYIYKRNSDTYMYIHTTANFFKTKIYEHDLYRTE